MRVLLPGEVTSKTGVPESTCRVWARQGKFPAPIPLGNGGSNTSIGYLESEIEEWIASRLAARAARVKKRPEGRSKFWKDVADGKRLHPRTIGRLRREAAAKSELPAWIVRVPGGEHGGTYREEEVAQRIAEVLRERGIAAVVERVEK